MELSDIIDVNELFSPLYPYVAKQVLEAYGRDSGLALELGPFAGGASIELAKQAEGLQVVMGDDYPGVNEYLERKVAAAGLNSRITVLPLNKLDVAFPEGTFDLAVFRGGLFFWEERRRMIEEMHRVLKPGGLAMVGGGFGADAPDALIEQVLAPSRDLNRKLGKTVLSEQNLRETLRDLGLEPFSRIDARHGLWAMVRKGAGASREEGVSTQSH